MRTETITTLTELAHIAHTVLTQCIQKDTATIITLSGDLGVGKTAFTKLLAQQLTVVHEITSPTFVIMKSYPIPTHSYLKTFTHIDAYRIESPHEMRVLGLAQLCEDPTQFICIEWPEKIHTILPKDVYKVTLTLNTDGTRTIDYGT